MVIGVACHPAGPGSIPVMGFIFFYFILKFICSLSYVVSFEKDRTFEICT